MAQIAAVSSLSVILATVQAFSAVVTLAIAPARPPALTTNSARLVSCQAVKNAPTVTVMPCTNPWFWEIQLLMPCSAAVNPSRTATTAPPVQDAIGCRKFVQSQLAMGCSADNTADRTLAEAARS